MKKWVILGLVGLVAVVSGAGVGYVYAEKRSVTNIVITDTGMQPSTVTGKVDTSIKIHVTNKGKKKHNLVIPDYYIFTHNLNSGESTDIEFKLNKKGSFSYFSDTPGTPEPGLEGKLTVE